ncbi:hypothetical protein Ct9H90mP29_10190 [bacterium]|nr:MAG: hypothetical protein Ct9H90mP29_10190 [bacterium]
MSILGSVTVDGGGITAKFSAEGNMVIGEGESSDHVDDYHDMELAFVNTSLEEAWNTLFLMLHIR